MRLFALVLCLAVVLGLVGIALRTPERRASLPATQYGLSTAPTTGPTQEQLRVAGFDESDEVRKFLRELQRAEERNDREAVVALMRFPFALYSQGKVRKRYTSRSALLADFDRVFTARVRSRIRSARFETLFFNYQGAMIGDGEVWFGKDGKVAITAVNP